MVHTCQTSQIWYVCARANGASPIARASVVRMVETVLYQTVTQPSTITKEDSEAADKYSGTATSEQDEKRVSRGKEDSPGRDVSRRVYSSSSGEEP